ncbi:MAG: VanW family protein [Polyangiaceae bacterium]|nr:VanW family protein [Polyangiaceae bacterium]
MREPPTPNEAPPTPTSDGPRSARRRAPRAPWVVAAGAALVAVPLVAYGRERLRADTHVAGRVVVAGRDVGGLPRAEVEAFVADLAAAWRRRPLVVQLGDARHEIAPEELGVRVDVQATGAATLDVGRASGGLAGFVDWASRLVTPRAVAVVTAVDPAALERSFDAWERAVGAGIPFEGALAYDRGKVSVEPPRAGKVIDRAEAAAAVAAGFASGAERPIELPRVERSARLTAPDLERAAAAAARLVAASVTLEHADGSVRVELSPDTIGRALRVELREGGAAATLDPATLVEGLGAERARIERTPADASFDPQGDTILLVPARYGERVDGALLVRAVLEAASAPARVGVLPLLRGDAPAVSTADLAALGIRRLVSRFTTRHPCCQARVENIHRIATLLDGKVVRPGETFSTNAHVGPRTTKNGFVAAPAIEEGEMVDVIGGGVSQFATTFFNAIFWGGYDILERQPHTYWFPRYPMGHEATLSHPKPDLVFRNDTDAAVLIDTSYDDTSITVRLFGDNGGRKVRAEVSARSDIVRPTTEYIPNAGLDPEREKVKEGGMIGWSVIVSREVRFSDGAIKQEKRKVTYKPKVRRVEVHPCKIPEGEPDYTGEKCPEPEAAGPAEVAPPGGAG